MRRILLVFVALVVVLAVRAQELNAKITINHNQISGTDASAAPEYEASRVALNTL